MRILVVKLSSLGDLFHALPLVHVLKRETGGQIDWVTQPDYVELVRCFGDVGRVIPFPRRGPVAAFFEYARVIRRESYDYVLDLQGLLKSALAGRLARGKVRIGPSFEREGARFLYHQVAGTRDKQRHAVEELLDFARHLNLPCGKPEFNVRFPKIRMEGRAPHVAFIPCSRWGTKNAPASHFVHVGRKLLAEYAGSTIHLLGSRQDRDACEGIRAELSGERCVNHAGRSSLVELGGLLQAMDLVLTVDSGPMHMAAALGRPVVALFGPTDPVRTGPFGEQTVVIRKEALECSPCFSRTCARHDHACMERLAPEIEHWLAGLTLDTEDRNDRHAERAD